mgnify:CR=1 FL=1
MHSGQLEALDGRGAAALLFLEKLAGVYLYDLSDEYQELTRQG